jgi:hypothetical protein
MLYIKEYLSLLKEKGKAKIWVKETASFWNL